MPSVALKNQKTALNNLDIEQVNPRVLVLMVSGLLVLAARKSGFAYAPSLRTTQSRAIVANIPKVLARINSLRVDVLRELYKAIRVDPDVYLKATARELAGLFAEE